MIPSLLAFFVYAFLFANWNRQLFMVVGKTPQNRTCEVVAALEGPLCWFEMRSNLPPHLHGHGFFAISLRLENGTELSRSEFPEASRNSSAICLRIRRVQSSVERLRESLKESAFLPSERDTVERELENASLEAESLRKSLFNTLQTSRDAAKMNFAKLEAQAGQRACVCFDFATIHSTCFLSDPKPLHFSSRLMTVVAWHTIVTLYIFLSRAINELFGIFLLSWKRLGLAMFLPIALLDFNLFLALSCLGVLLWIAFRIGVSSCRNVYRASEFATKNFLPSLLSSAVGVCLSVILVGLLYFFAIREVVSRLYLGLLERDLVSQFASDLFLSLPSIGDVAIFVFELFLSPYVYILLFWFLFYAQEWRWTQERAT